MAYVIDPAKPLPEQLRKVAARQAGHAIEDLESPGDDVVEAVHDCRTRCKKIRGLVRLVRPALGDHYGPANAAFRDAAHELGSLRDAQSLLGTFDDLLAHLGHVDEGSLAPVRAELVRRSDDAVARAVPDGPEVQRALALLHEGRGLVDTWELQESGFGAIAGGAGLSYRRGRAALRRATEAPTAEHFHEYRKRVKDTWYHLKLLEPRAPSTLHPLARRFHDLSDALGDEHDLAVLSAQLLDRPECFGGDPPVAAAMVLLDAQRADLQRRAVRLGWRLHAEKAGTFVDRLARYDRAWHEQGEELPAGSISSLD